MTYNAYCICATSTPDIICRKKRSLKTGASWKQALVTMSQDLPTTGQNTISCTAESHTRLLSNGAKHCGAHSLQVPSQGLHTLPAHPQGSAVHHTLVRTKGETTSVHPGLFISSFWSHSSSLLESRMSPALKCSYAKLHWDYILPSHTRQIPSWH